MEEENNTNVRFYILLLLLIIIAFIITYFNYKMVNNIMIPSLENATYESILKHTKILKNIKKFT